MEERWFWYVYYINVLENVILSFTIHLEIDAKIKAKKNKIFNVVFQIFRIFCTAFGFILNF